VAVWLDMNTSIIITKNIQMNSFDYMTRSEEGMEFFLVQFHAFEGVPDRLLIRMAFGKWSGVQFD
jgi:hypothetical protein